MSNIIRRYIDHMKFAAYTVLPFITFFHILLVPVISLYIWLYVLYAFVWFVNYVFYCYVYVFLLLRMFCSVYSVSLCCSVYSLCVNVYCTTATGCQHNCS